MRSVSASGTNATIGRVNIVFTQIGGASGVPGGEAVTYVGTCTPGGIRWTVSASANFPNKFLPKQ